MGALDFHRGGLEQPLGQGNPHLLQNEERKTQVPCETANPLTGGTGNLTGGCGESAGCDFGEGDLHRGQGSRAMNKIAVCWEHLRDSGHFVHLVNRTVPLPLLAGTAGSFPRGEQPPERAGLRGARGARGWRGRAELRVKTETSPPEALLRSSVALRLRWPRTKARGS